MYFFVNKNSSGGHRKFMIVAFHFCSFRPPWGNEKMLIFEAIPLRLMFSRGFSRFLSITFFGEGSQYWHIDRTCKKDFERQKSFNRNMIAQMNKI